MSLSQDVLGPAMMIHFKFPLRENEYLACDQFNRG